MKCKGMINIFILVFSILIFYSNSSVGEERLTDLIQDISTKACNNKRVVENRINEAIDEGDIEPKKLYEAFESHFINYLSLLRGYSEDSIKYHNIMSDVCDKAQTYDQSMSSDIKSKLYTDIGFSYNSAYDSGLAQNLEEKRLRIENLIEYRKSGCNGFDENSELCRELLTESVRDFFAEKVIEM